MSSSSTTTPDRFSLSKVVQTAWMKYSLSDEEIKECSTEQLKAYGRLLQEPEHKSVDYSVPAQQGAYIRMFVLTHAIMIAQVLGMQPDLAAFLAGKTNSKLSTMCLGGGPGSDVLGLVYYLDAKRITGVHLIASILDKVDDWAIAWRKITLEIKQANINSIFRAFDTTNGKHVSDLPRWVEDVELVIMSKFASAIYKCDNTASFYTALFHSLAPASFVIIMDNWCPPTKVDCFTSECINIALQEGMEVLFEDKKIDVNKADFVEDFEHLWKEIALSQSRSTYAPKLPKHMLAYILRKKATPSATTKKEDPSAATKKEEQKE